MFAETVRLLVRPRPGGLKYIVLFSVDMTYNRVILHKEKVPFLPEYKRVAPYYIEGDSNEGEIGKSMNANRMRQLAIENLCRNCRQSGINDVYDFKIDLQVSRFGYGYFLASGVGYKKEEPET